MAIEFRGAPWIHADPREIDGVLAWFERAAWRPVGLRLPFGCRAEKRGTRHGGGQVVAPVTVVPDLVR